ncbi:putative Hydrophobic surface binding protein A [Seiridium cardinale]|uniref:Hydrophobic surface binding protein A n=1 Tax=Seiridium cardinale TaxID=138064 RepID=A0ABR2XCF8_9PEZI
MVKVAAIALFATAVFGTARRDVAETLENLQAIDTATNELTSTITAWDGSTVGAIGIASSANALGDQIDAANDDASDEEVASSADSATVISYITETGEPDIATSLNDLVSREADFESAGVASVVLSTLESLKNKTDTYGATLYSITSTDQQAAAQAAIDQLDADFAAAIAAFS